MQKFQRLPYGNIFLCVDKIRAARVLMDERRDEFICKRRSQKKHVCKV